MDKKRNEVATPDIIVLKFADSKIPVFKEARNKDYIKYGDDNLYPEYLNFLYNKSGKHNAILGGKANYIFGSGYENGDQIINRNNDSLNDIAKKAILDIEIFGGYRLEIIWNRAGRIAEIYHVDYSTIRKGKEGGYYYKESWQPSNRDEEIQIDSFNPSHPIGRQIFAYDEYRPGVRYYPLPGYIGSNNYIETDIEISKYYLSGIRNGMMPSKMVQFFTGEPTDDKKREVERRLTQKFSGAENAGKFFLVFNDKNSANGVKVDDLSASDLDKHMIELNKTCQQEIFSGHLVTSPMLFGIKTEGQLGGTAELKTAYEIFINTYAKPKANAFDREFNWLMSYSSLPAKYELRQTDPIGLQFDVKDFIDKIPIDFVFEKLGIPKENLPAQVAPALASEKTIVNDVLTNLTGRQKINIDRIVRHYENGKTSRAMAVAMLKKGYGFDDDDIIAFLGEDVQQVALSAVEEDDIIGMFDECGEDKGDYEILKSKKVSFEVEELEAHEAAFKLFNPTPSEQAILDAVKINPKVTVEEISSLTKTTESYVNRKIQSLITEGYLEGEIGALLVPPRIGDIINGGLKNPVSIFIKYSYEGPQDSRNRPFCAKLMSLNRLYTRYDIEKISERLGYSVFDRGGGFWRQPDGTTLPHCRHRWDSHIVVKKGGDK